MGAVSSRTFYSCPHGCSIGSMLLAFWLVGWLVGWLAGWSPITGIQSLQVTDMPESRAALLALFRDRMGCLLHG